jgi:hypothetical protein
MLAPFILGYGAVCGNEQHTYCAWKFVSWDILFRIQNSKEIVMGKIFLFCVMTSVTNESLIVGVYNEYDCNLAVTKDYDSVKTGCVVRHVECVVFRIYYCYS